MDTFHICLLSILRATVLTYCLIVTLNLIYPWMRVRVYAMSSVHIPLITHLIANNLFWLGSDVEVNFPAWRLSVFFFFLLWRSEDGHLNSQSRYECFICFCPYEGCFRFVFMRWLIWCCSGTQLLLFFQPKHNYICSTTEDRLVFDKLHLRCGMNWTLLKPWFWFT